MRYSLCVLQGVDPCGSTSPEEMTAEEWARFKTGNAQLNGYESFDFVTRNYSFRKVLETFFNVKGITKETALNYLAYSNGYIYPGPEEDETPTTAMRRYEEENRIFKRTIDLLEPEYLFVFSAEVWKTESMWPGEWSVDRGAPLDEMSFFDERFIGQTQKTKCIAIRIPHLSRYVRKSFEPLIETFRGQVGRSVPLDEMLQIIKEHVKMKYPNSLI